MSEFRKFLVRFGWKGFISLSFYPITILITTPVRLCKSLWNARVLAMGKDWGIYPHFCAYSAINSLFYWTRALNLFRFGRSGTSPYIGLGNSSMARFFHYSLPSLYAYWKAGAVSLVVGMFGWWTAHFLWLDQTGVSAWWVVMVLALVLFSTTFYANVFSLQNYNALGWMFMPIVLYAWTDSLWMLATLAILCAGFGSFTVIFLTFWLSVIYSYHIGSIFPILTMAPSLIKIAAQSYPHFKAGGLKDAVLSLSKAMGLTKGNVRYHRNNGRAFDISWLYLLVIYVQFIACVVIFAKMIPLLLIVAVAMWVTNTKFARFADHQSLYMLILSVATATIIQSTAQTPWIIISFWILVSPVPLFARFFPDHNNLIVVPQFRPFNIEPIIEEIESFLSPVSRDQRVLMAFDDPQGDYGRLFDGYSVLLQVPLYVSSKKHIHFMPDWWGVFELNYEGAPDFWGRGVHEVERQMKTWGADYVVVYQPSGTKLHQKWSKAGFREENRFSWEKFEDLLGDVRPYRGPTPDWWLLKKQN